MHCAAMSRKGNAPSRAGKHAVEILQGFNGVLLVDGYTGYNRVKERRDNIPIELADCWAHALSRAFAKQNPAGQWA